MCWTGNVYDRHIAESPKRVFKVLERKNRFWSSFDSNYVLQYHSYHMGLVYVPGKEYYRELYASFRMYVSSIRVDITGGLRSYSFDKCCILFGHNSSRDIDLLVVGDSGIEIDRYLRKTDHHFEARDTVVVECTIPAGAVYFENEMGEIISNRLIINKEIEI